ncbi:MAG TPA: hypothetical protein VGP85_24415 [Pyrinomonadaceae bacterium]|nr:hypothetical protein [Pyrinomonadaceae bacterium]
MDNNRVKLSLTLIVLVCFFLPWVQVSCGSSRDTLSGIDLAGDGHGSLWFIPLLMIVIVLFNIGSALKAKQKVSALITLIAGLLSAYLMNRERVRAEDSAGLITVGLTGWFWLAFGSALALVVLALIQILRLPRRTSLRS